MNGCRRRREQLDLAGEALGAERRADLRTKHLDRDGALVANVVRQVHGRHPARSKLALERVPLGERVAQRFRDDPRGGHCRTMSSETSNVNEAGHGDAADTNDTVPPRLPHSIHQFRRGMLLCGASATD